MNKQPHNPLPPGASPLTGVAPPVETRFKPGNRVNPGGVPKSVMHARRLAAKASPAIIERMAKFALTEEPKYAIPAGALVLERGLGKAAAMRELYPLVKPDTDTEGAATLSALNDDQRARIYAIIREGLA